MASCVCDSVDRLREAMVGSEESNVGQGSFSLFSTLGGG